MIEITKNEAKAIYKVYPCASIYRTKHGSSNRGKHYLTAELRYLNLIKDSNLEAKDIISNLNKKNHRTNYHNHKLDKEV